MSEKQNYSYKKTEWKNDETHLNASNMNNMEYGIDLSVRTSAQNTRDIEDHNNKIEILNGTEEIEGSVKRTVRDAKNELIGDYTEAYEGKKLTSIASTVEYFQGEVDSINQEITDTNKDINDKYTEINQTINTQVATLQKNIDAVSGNSTEAYNNHVENKNNPHEVTAAQLNVYTKKESEAQKKDVENQIKAAQSSAFLEVDKSQDLVENSTSVGSFTLTDIADVQPIIIYVDITSDQEFDGLTKIGQIDLINGLSTYENYYEVYTLGTHKIVFDKLDNEPLKDLTVEWYNKCNCPVNVSVSYLKQSELLKLLDYVDFTMGGNLITSGTSDPDENVTSEFYFRYSDK